MAKKQGKRNNGKTAVVKRKATAEEPQKPTIKEFTRARDMFRNGNFDDAAAILESILKKQPGDFEASVLLASCYSFQGKYDEAVHCHENAVKADPRDAQRWHNLASDLLNLGDLEKAEKAMREALRLDGKRGFSHYGLARIIARRGDNEEALAILKRAVQLQPELKDNLSDQPDFAVLAEDNRFKELLGLKKDEFDYPFFERGET